MNGRNFAIAVALMGLAGPSVRAAETLPCSSLDSLRTSAEVVRAGDGLLAENLYSYFCWDPMARFEIDAAHVPAFVSAYLISPSPQSEPEEASVPPPPPRPDPNGGGGGGSAR